MLELCYELRTPFVISIADNQVCEKLVSFLCFHLCECVCFYFVFFISHAFLGFRLINLFSLTIV